MCVVVGGGGGGGVLLQIRYFKIKANVFFFHKFNISRSYVSQTFVCVWWLGGGGGGGCCYIHTLVLGKKIPAQGAKQTKW